MPKFQTTRRVPYSARQMYDIIADVEKYPLFLPLCEALAVESRQTTGDTTVIIATMSVGYKTIRESFRTKVTLKPAEPSILVEYLDGPFKRLENRWNFTAAGSGSDVHFFIDYEFRSIMLGVLMGACLTRRSVASARRSKSAPAPSTARPQPPRPEATF